MKTQILHLDPHDDFISARDKMGWSSTDRILLVWPARQGVLHRRLDLALIQRHSKTLGAQLALVTLDPEVRYFARELGIPVFKTLGRAQKSAWRPPRWLRVRPPVLPPAGKHERPNLALLRQQAHPPSPAWLNRTAARLGLFLLGLLAYLAIAAAIVPGAEVEIDPQTIPQFVTLQVQASPDFSTVDLGGKVPARLQRVTVEGRASERASGIAHVPDQYASGEVTLTNLSDMTVTVPKGTVISTRAETPVRFETTRTGQVPAGPAAALSLPIRALLPGSSGNLAAGELEALEGPLGSALTVTNPAATQGGSVLRGPAPSQKDYDRLESRLMDSLEQTALEELAEVIEPGDILLEDTLSLRQTVERSFDPQASQPADWLHLNLRLEYEAQVVSEEDLHALAAGALDADLPVGFQAQAGPVEISHLSTPKVEEDGSAHWRLEASRELQALASPAQVIRLARGLRPAQAQQRLSSGLLLASPPRIELFPIWWPRLPFVPFRIKVSSGQ